MMNWKEWFFISLALCFVVGAMIADILTVDDPGRGPTIRRWDGRIVEYEYIPGEGSDSRRTGAQGAAELTFAGARSWNFKDEFLNIDSVIPGLGGCVHEWEYVEVCIPRIVNWALIWVLEVNLWQTLREMYWHAAEWRRIARSAPLVPDDGWWYWSWWQLDCEMGAPGVMMHDVRVLDLEKADEK